MGERWYPDLLAQIRAKEAAMDKLSNGHVANGANGANGVTVANGAKKEETLGTVGITA